LALINFNQMEKFVNSGRFICKESYLEKNPTEKLLKECTDVVEYIDGSYIQVLESGEFYVDSTFKSRSLDEAEIKLWEKINK
jgi:hypothetical protein